MAANNLLVTAEGRRSLVESAFNTSVHQFKLESRTVFALAGGAIPQARVNAASLQAYADCFRMMAIAALIVSPGVLLFRPRAEAREVTKAA